MDAKEFREFGKAAVDFVADYLENIRDHEVLPSVEPGYLLDLLPKDMPEEPEHWTEVLSDINRVIKPGITHWQSPNMHGYYPTSTSYPSIVGEMLASGFGIIGFSWICSPACTELEVVVMDWLAKFLKLPEHFQHASDGPGGGVIQGSASEAVLVAVLAAREQAVISCKETHPELSESEVRGKLIAYSSDQSNSCIEKAGVLAAMPIKLLPADDDLILRGNTLRKAIEDDVAAGLIPVICIATLGTTGTCAYDDIDSLADVCQALNVWLHVDAAYAGGGFALEECTDLRRGLDRVDSLNFNLHKFMLVNFDCSAMWLRDANKVVDSFNVDRIYLKHKHEGQSQIPDFRHWQIPLGRRFRALKVWITFRTLGAEGLRSHVRKHIALAQQFEAFVRNDSRFEMVAPQALGLVCFRPRGDNEHTAQLLQRLMERKKIYMVKAEHAGRQFLRFAVCGMDAKPSDIEFAWTEIETQLTALLAEKSLPARKPSNVSELTQHFQMHLASDSGTHEKSQ
ncbi:3,4-dihydroxyphenylacetaldehyde synthase 2 isoform X1 [Drosophila miranda]|nr:3,4-dihydroxyphenylacetaldehyde synthase 2 isoform X1 [Drosophila miranda]